MNSTGSVAADAGSHDPRNGAVSSAADAIVLRSVDEQTGGQTGESPLTRRQASAVIGTGVLGVAGGLAAIDLAARSAMAQPAGTPAANPATTPGTTPATPRPPSPLDKLMQQGQIRSRDVRFMVEVFAASERSPHSDEIIVSGSFRIDQAAILVPMVESSGSSMAFVDEATSSLRAFDRDHPFEFSLLDPMMTSFAPVGPMAPGQTPPPAFEPTWGEGGVRYGRWEVQNAGARSLRLTLNYTVESWETRFDQQAAGAIEWPNSPWPAGLRACLGGQAGINPRDPALVALLNELTGGREPTSIKPLDLAKFLCAELVNRFQISGNGLRFDRGGQGRPGGVAFEGYEEFRLEDITRNFRGPPHTLSATLCSLYRAAGLPARIVLASDATGTFDGPDNPLLRSRRGGMVSWVEFCLFDPDAGRELWVPVDPVQLRSTSSRAPDWRRPWRNFLGSHNKLGDAIPLSFHFMPPFGGAIGYGSYGLWGWITSPRANNGLQRLTITSVTTPRRSGDRRRDRNR